HGVQVRYNAPPTGKAFDYWSYAPEAGGWSTERPRDTYAGEYGSAPASLVLPTLRMAALTGFITPLIAGHGSPGARDPIDLPTGTPILRYTDLAVGNSPAIHLVRTHRPDGLGHTRSFGPGTTHNFDLFLIPGDEVVRLILPDGTEIRFERDGHPDIF